MWCCVIKTRVNESHFDQCQLRTVTTMQDWSHLIIWHSCLRSSTTRHTQSIPDTSGSDWICTWGIEWSFESTFVFLSDSVLFYSFSFFQEFKNHVNFDLSIIYDISKLNLIIPTLQRQWHYFLELCLTWSSLFPLYSEETFLYLLIIVCARPLGDI